MSSINTNLATSGTEIAPSTAGIDTNASDINTDATNAVNDANAGLTNSLGIGGIPEYSALANAISQLGQQSVSLPPDLNLAIDNQALNELGASQAATALTGGGVASAERSVLGDQVANASVGGNLNKSRSAATNALQQGNATAMQASQNAGQQSNSNTLAEAHNRLQQWIQQGQAYTANAQIQNTAQSFGTTLNNAQTNGTMAVYQDAQSGLAALAAASLANDQAEFGNLMTGIRAGMTAASGAAAAATSYLKNLPASSGDVNEDSGNANASTDDGAAATSSDGNDAVSPLPVDESYG